MEDELNEYLAKIGMPPFGTPAFQKEVRRQAKLLRNSPEEKEIMEFIEKAADWPTE